MPAEFVPVMMWLWCNAFLFLVLIYVAFMRLQGIKMGGIASWFLLVTFSKKMRGWSYALFFVSFWPVLGTFWQGCRCLGYDCFYKFLQYLLLAKYGEVCILWSTVKEKKSSKLGVSCPLDGTQLFCWPLFCSPLVCEPWDYCIGEGCRGQMEWMCKEACFDWFGASYSVRKSQLRNRTA